MSDADVPRSIVRSIGDRLPAIVWSARPDGSLVYINAAWTELTGQPAARAIEGGWSDLVHPDEREATVAAWERAVRDGGDYEREVRVRSIDGSYRWLLERAIPTRDATGEIVMWYGATVDVDDRRRADAARELFAALVENSTDFIALAEPDGKFLFLNEAGRRLVGLPVADTLRGRSLFEVFADSDRSRLEREIRPALGRGESWSGETGFRSFSGDRGPRIPVEGHLFQIRDDRGGVRALATVTVDRTSRDRIERRLEILVDASVELTRSLDPERTMQAAVRFVADRFASYSLLDVKDDESGQIRRVAVAHGDARRQPLVEALSAFNAPAEVESTHPVSRAIVEGTPTLETIDAAWIERAALSPAHAKAMLDLDLRMLLVVPVVGAVGTIGALTCALDARSEREAYDAGDVGFATELGRRIGLAIENARSFARERRIAVTLQAASLPRGLPVDRGLRIDAEYRPGSSEATIGGDWYDAFVLDDGRIVLTIGDVMGHGLDAAVMMSKLRQAMRGAALVRPDPSEMLDVADRTLRFENENAFATALAAVYDPARAMLDFAVAGHPRPIVRAPGPSGIVELLDHHGVMLGLRTLGTGETKSIPMPLGTSIVFYTDGLVELTRDYAEGERRLREAIGRTGLFEGWHPAQAIVDEILTGQTALDDLAVMTATAVPDRVPGSRPKRSP